MISRLVKETVNELSCYQDISGRRCENQNRMKEEGREHGEAVGHGA